MSIRKPFFLFTAFITFSLSAFGQKRIYVNEYLNIGVGGRGLAMAGAQAATSNDVMSAYYNPAGLLKIENDVQIGLMHAEYFSGISKYDFGGIVKTLKDKKRAIGLTVLRFAVDDIPNTIDYVQPDGSFDETKLKSMSAGDYAFLLSYAQGLKLFHNPEIQTNIGVNAKVIYRQLGSLANAWGAGLDAGIQTSYRQWHFGLMMKDITTTYTAWTFHLSEHDKQVFGQTGNEIPIKSYEIMYPRFNLGIAKSLIKPGAKMQLLAELDMDMTTDGKRNTLVGINDFSLDPHLGLELGYKNTIFLRGGIGNIQRVLDDRDTMNLKKYTLYQPSVGLGIMLKSFVVDYAFTSLQTQSNPLFTHIISIRLNINAAKRIKKETAPEPEDKPATEK